MNKLMIIGLFAVFFLTACEEPPIYKADYYCRVLTNESGHDLKITLIREDTTVQYHIANNESAIFDSGEGFLMIYNPPGYIPYTGSWRWIPDTIVERTAIVTFDDTYSHVSREIFFYDSVGELVKIKYIPEDCNMLAMNRPFFDFHNVYPDYAVTYKFFFTQSIVTPAYYERAVEENMKVSLQEMASITGHSVD